MYFDGSFEFISKIRTMYKNFNFLLDVEKDGNKIIDAISSKREENNEV